MGIHVSLVTSFTPEGQAIEGLELESIFSLSNSSPAEEAPWAEGGKLPQRFIRYWGSPASHIDAVARIAGDINARAVIASGLDALPLLYRVVGATRVWYAADEWSWHHLSLLRLSDPSSWAELKQAIIKGLYERAFNKSVDRIWVVSDSDQRAMRMVTAVRNVDVISNGVDTSYYAPHLPCDEVQQSIIFWGRLDFGPNLQALEWFCRKVWPLLFSQHRDATFTIMGAKPIDAVRQLSRMPGIRLLPDVEDLRPEIASHQVAVLPFISGGGIKNKLLEAAAMGKPIVCSEKATSGLRGIPKVLTARSVHEWQSKIEDLWNQEEQRRALGAAAREWVCHEHSWDRAAAGALGFLQYPVHGPANRPRPICSGA
jgi:glycosyltransferase involved in cell wall biosynthesis